MRPSCAAAHGQPWVLIAAVIVLLLSAAPGIVEATNLSQGSTVHTVRSGDTLHAIASRYGTTVQAIMSANGLTNSTIIPGQRISVAPESVTARGWSVGSVPASSQSGSAGSYPIRSATGSYYVVGSGETLSQIARANGVSVTALKQANNLSSNTILVGQTLTMPAVSKTYVPAASVRAGSGAWAGISGTSSATGTFASGLGTCGGIYTVQRGDTLSTIASRCGLSYDALVTTNTLTRNVLHVGQSLELPGVTSQPHVTSTPVPPRPAWNYSDGP